MGVRFESYYEQIRCQVLLDMMYDLLRRERTADNDRMLQIVQRQLPERLQSGVAILTEAEQASGSVTGWVRTADQNGSVPGWAEVGPDAGAGWITSDSEESYYPESDGESVEAQREDIRPGEVETSEKTVGRGEKTVGRMVDETVSAAVETVGPINTVDPISEAM